MYNIVFVAVPVDRLLEPHTIHENTHRAQHNQHLAYIVDVPMNQPREHRIDH